MILDVRRRCAGDVPVMLRATKSTKSRFSMQSSEKISSLSGAVSNEKGKIMILDAWRRCAGDAASNEKGKIMILDAWRRCAGDAASNEINNIKIFDAKQRENQ